MKIRVREARHRDQEVIRKRRGIIHNRGSILQPDVARKDRFDHLQGKANESRESEGCGLVSRQSTFVETPGSHDMKDIRFLTDIAGEWRKR